MNLTTKEINLTDAALKEAGLIHMGDVSSPSGSVMSFIFPKSLLGSNNVLKFIELCGLADMEHPQVMKSDTFYNVELTIEAYVAIGKQVTKTIAK